MPLADQVAGRRSGHREALWVHQVYQGAVQTPSASQPLAELNSYLGLRVRNIGFQQVPSVDQSPEQLRQLLPLKSGSIVTRAAVHESLQSLYLLGFFGQIAIIAAPVGWA